VAERPDELGQLARVFQRMAHEIYARERRLRLQIEQLRIDIEERQQATSEEVTVYLPIDRRVALAEGRDLPERAQGAVLIADISGFTPLTEALAHELGFQRGAEEITRQLNRIYRTLIAEVDTYGGSVITFTGDAITCWFADDTPFAPSASENGTARALTCALAMQQAIIQVGNVATPGGLEIRLALKVVVVSGHVRRMLVGDPAIQQIEVLAGAIMETLTTGEHIARAGEVLAHSSAIEALNLDYNGEWRSDPVSGDQFALVSELPYATAAPWPNITSASLASADLRPWLAAPVYERVRSGQSAFLSELRSVAALFLSFSGIDHEGDPAARDKIDAFTRWVQAVLNRYNAPLLQLTIGEKGSFLYAAFGAPVSHEDAPLHSIRAALELRTPPPELSFITSIHIGISYGQTSAGAYGGPTRRTYGMLGDRTNLAARLMQYAEDILCDDALYKLTHPRIKFVALPPLSVKGKSEPVPVYRPIAEIAIGNPASQIDQLKPTLQLVLKVASVIGNTFSEPLLHAVYPVAADIPELALCLATLSDHGLIIPGSSDSANPTWSFAEASIRELLYSRLMYAQRRQLHRAIAEWYEQAYADQLAPYAAVIANHWAQAEEREQAIRYLEQAATVARQRGDNETAMHYLSESLAMSNQ
jgi:class 3 adenylate cyclase